jgi:hypothetical protein
MQVCAVLAAACLGVATRAQAGGPGPAAPPLHLGACGPVPGAYQLPGTAACLRVSGFVATEIGAGRMPASFGVAGLQTVTPARTAPNLGVSSIAADARFSADLRIPTDYGPARVYVAARARHGARFSAP